MLVLNRIEQATGSTAFSFPDLNREGRDHRFHKHFGGDCTVLVLVNFSWNRVLNVSIYLNASLFASCEFRVRHYDSKLKALAEFHCVQMNHNLLIFSILRDKCPPIF